MKIRFTLLALAITLSLTAAAPEPDFRAMYAGVYSVQIDGQPASGTSEVFILLASGQAEWRFATGSISSIKSGRWYATENIININLNGQNGTVTQTFKLAPNGVWRSGSRYFKKN